MKTQRIKLSELRELVKKQLNESLDNFQGTEDDYLNSPEYFVETYHNGQFGQLRKMLSNFKSSNKMKDLLDYLNEMEMYEIKDWLIINM